MTIGICPLRQEKHASFKVNRKKNIWYDFGIGEGGTIIDFGIRYHHCTISTFLDKLKGSFSFHQPDTHESIAAGQKKKTTVIAATPITSPALCRYLIDRSITPALAQKYCKEVHYTLDGRHYYAVGFQDNSGGYELRNAWFKGCIAPKDVTVIPGRNAKEMAVFEGFFSFLSYLKLQEANSYKLPDLLTTFLILNSLSFFKRGLEIMERHERITLYLDRDKDGMNYLNRAIKANSKYKDGSEIYDGYKDFNDILVHKAQFIKSIKKIGRRL